VAARTGNAPDWLNDAVKGFFSDQSEYDTFLELSHLKVMTARAEYLLAMKCLAMRIGEEFFDVEDVRYLIRYLNLRSYQQVLDRITKYYPLERFPQKTLYALEEILEEGHQSS
jgi:type III secretory pathway component EscV